MPLHHATVRKLANQAEWTLIQSSFGREITAHTPERLKQKFERARALRDKYRDKARQQRGEARGKRGPKSTRAAQGNANTKLKATMFAEAMSRFQLRMAELRERSRAKKAAKGAKKTGVGSRARKATKSGAKSRAMKSSAKPATRIVRRSAWKGVKQDSMNGVQPGEATSMTHSDDMHAPGRNPWEEFEAAKSTSEQAHSQESRWARKQQKLSHQSGLAHQAHVGSRGRRDQAKRDSR